MLLNQSYHPDFDALMERLQAKYPKKLFDMDGIGDQLDMAKFSKKFFSVKTTADASIDANSNVDDMSVIAYDHEVPKANLRLNSYYVLWKQIMKTVGLAEANEAVERNLIGDIYINDFHGIGAGKSYCFNYSTYDLLIKGLPMIQKIHSLPPKHFLAFRSQLEQFVVIASNSTLGATGLADMLVVMSYFVQNMLKTLSDAHFHFASEADVWAYVKETLISFVYTVNQPLRAHQCVTEDTEVLTPDGFKTLDELEAGDPIYTWKDGNLNINPVQRVNIYDHDGEMHRYSGRDAIQEVTPNHRVLYKNGAGRFVLKDSSKLIDAKTPLYFPVAMFEDARPDYPISDDMLRLCTMVLTDGNMYLGKGRTIPRVRVYKSPKREGRTLIEQTLSNLGFAYTFNNRPSGYEGETLDHFSIAGEPALAIFDLLDGRKDKLPSWMLNLSKRQAKLVIDLWATFDGYTDADKYGAQKLQVDNYVIADQLQHLCFLAGQGSRITERLIGNNKKATIYVMPYQRNVKACNTKERFHYTGRVWCPTTEDGIVVFRKDGKLFISGNSPFSNISIYDKNFLEAMLPDYLFPDGTTPDIAIVQKLQDLFLVMMNEEMQRTPITFPVTTACFSVNDQHELMDRQFLNFIAEQNKRFGFINIYVGKSSTLSSCCFRGDQKVVARIRLNDEALIEREISLKDLYEHYQTFKKNYDDVQVEIRIPRKGHIQWGFCTPVKLPWRPIYRIRTDNNQELVATDNHIHLVWENYPDGIKVDLSTIDLRPGMILIQELSNGERGGTEILEIVRLDQDKMEDVYCVEMQDQSSPYFVLANGVITHNCRLRSNKESEYFNSFGSGSSKIGSLGVCTINLPKLHYQFKDMAQLEAELIHLTELCGLINHAKRQVVQKRIKNGNHPLYTLGFTDLKRQYSTVGINGFNEAIELAGLDPMSEAGIDYGLFLIDTINKANDRMAKHYKFPHNTEQIPGESVSIKLAAKDRLLGFQDQYTLYSNQFIPLTAKADLLDRMRLQGVYDGHFSGGAICHLNVETEIQDESQIANLIEAAAKMGVVYFAINYNLQECEDGHMSVGRKETCAICGKPIINNYTRVVGFLTNTKNWHQVRREQDYPNRQFYGGDQV